MVFSRRAAVGLQPDGWKRSTNTSDELQSLSRQCGCVLSASQLDTHTSAHPLFGKRPHLQTHLSAARTASLLACTLSLSVIHFDLLRPLVGSPRSQRLHRYFQDERFKQWPVLSCLHTCITFLLITNCVYMSGCLN